MADVKTLFAVILAFLFAFEVNTLGLIFDDNGFCPNGINSYLKIIKCNGTSCCARISGRSCNPSKTSFNIINAAPATKGKKCIQFTKKSVSYALRVIGTTDPPTLKFMKQRLCNETSEVDNAFLFEEQPIISGSYTTLAYIYTHNKTRMCLSRVCNDPTLILKPAITPGPQDAAEDELNRMCSFRRKNC